MGNGLAWWMGGFGFFAGLATFIAIYSPKKLNQVTPRTGLVDPMKDLIDGGGEVDEA